MRLDAVVVGAGPNGLAAAITLAAAGRSVRVLEAAQTPGGGARTAELTLPGYLHDVCAAIHPLAACSPFFRRHDLAGHGLRLVHPEIALAHPLDGGRAAVLHRSLERTAAGLGPDGRGWRRLVGALSHRWGTLATDLLGARTLRPRDPVGLAALAALGALPATALARAFSTPEARALLGGSAAHSFLPLTHPLSATFGLVLSAGAHAGGWPAAQGGSGRLVDAMVSLLESLGGSVECERPVRGMADLPASRCALFDVAPRRLADIGTAQLPARYLRRLRRYRHGPGVLKLDYALSEPVPWANSACRAAGTVHVGGTIEEVAAAEAAVWRGRHPERPFVLVAQQSVFDSSRTPDDGHTLWAYTHVPAGSPRDVHEDLERQIERFAPGFRDTIVARHVAGPAWYEAYNANDVGGDISGGSHGGLQLLRRPTWLHPHRTPNPRILLCSASTPPGAGVHGMCGENAARVALSGVLA